GDVSLVFEKNIRLGCGARASRDDNDPRIEQKWNALTVSPSENESETWNFLQVCTKTELSLLSEVFEEVGYNLQSKKYIELLYILDQRYPDLNLKSSIKVAEQYMG